MDKIEEKLTYFYSIGPIQAKKILDKLINLKLIDEQKAKNDEYTIPQLRKILKTKIIHEDLPDALKIDLKYKPLRTIPRVIIDLINSEFQKYIKDIKFDVAGSYIRQKPTSGDIDVVISTYPKGEKTGEYFINTINKHSRNIKFLPPFAHGDNNISALIAVKLDKLVQKYPILKKLSKIGVVYAKIDIFTSDPDEYVFALLYATGSGKFNLRMRALAKRKGLFLNNHGLFKKISNDVLERIPIKTEKEIFDALGMAYKVPEKRIL